MKGREYDCIVAPAASTELALFRSQIPVVYVSDTTFQLISNFYTWDFEKMPAISRWEGNTIERLALQHSTGVVLSSNWATNSAIHDYGVPAEKILTIPLGANVDFVPEADVIFQKLQGQELTLLYLAVEWERKGGPLAFETLQQLHAKGVKAKLIICGCIPPSQFQHPYMEVIPFLNKNKKEDHDKFVELLSTVHFLLLPTRADCSLLVSCEASAYGVPVISTRTGGVNEVVLDDVNGYCLPHEAKGEAYAEVILKIYSDRARYEKLIHSSRKRYENHLNWDQWAKDFIRFYESKFTRTQS
jgi:glycosyltransferase involved in cell wall biosynthesis